MKRKSITFKLFIITAAFFIIFISITMLLQSLFIERFYLYKKMRDFDTNFRNLSTNFTNMVNDPDKISELLFKFETENNARVMTADLSGGLKIQIKASSSTSLSPEDNRVIGFFEDSKISVLASGIKQWFSDPEAVSKVINDGETVTFRTQPESSGGSSIIGIAPVSKDGAVLSALVAVTSLQPIGEAAGAIREFYIYFYGIALLLIIILSSIFSNMISKPLVSLNNTASKMAELDFSSKCSIKSEDEIGSMSNTLNFLSERLNTALTDLKAANKKLIEDIEKEKQMEKMRKEFVAGVSHELKTPIALISGYAEGIKDNIADDKKREYYANIIMDESSRMAALVSDMLDLSQLESGSFKLEIDRFYINDLINSIAGKYHANTLLSGKKLNISMPAEDAEVTGDRFRIEQVITNLLNNAIKYTPEGGIIEVRLKDSKASLLVEIENPGEHIPEGEITNIWEKFYKVEKSRNRSLGGTGIGLAIVKDILNLHKSQYGAENTEYGVKFYFTLEKFDSYNNLEI